MVENIFSSTHQIRLAELSVYNWGSFHGLHNAKFDPQGTLITGDNGSGKSTFIDGLMALLLPTGKAAFNMAAAQGDTTDRSLVSYMRGHFGTDHDAGYTKVKSKRDKAVLTGLRALYQEDNGELISLSALFWISSTSNTYSDVKRLYIVAKKNLSLKELLTSFDNENIRKLKQELRDDSTVKYSGENFTDYQAVYQRYLGMTNRNAPSLLSRALGLKKIDDLTKLIRELVLEPSTIREEAKKVVEEFVDLEATHKELVEARNQQQTLIELPSLQEILNKTEQQLILLTKQKDGLNSYLGEIGSKLWGDRLAELNKRYQHITLLTKQLEYQINETTEEVERKHAAYLKAGGNQIIQLQQQLEYAKKELNRTVQKASEYQILAKNLSLNDALTEQQFNQNTDLAKQQIEDFSQKKEKVINNFLKKGGDLSLAQTKHKEIEQEISEIKTRPDSNIDIKYQQLRDSMVAALSLERELCIFAGELIDVNEHSRDWQGAIERALGGLRTTLLVPHDQYSLVTRWLNNRHTGLHVRVQVVNIKELQPVQFKEQGFLKKLVWRNHPYRDWLKKHLSHFDLSCVATTQLLDNTPFSMTKQGLTHKEKGRFEKKDQYKIDDRRYWQLGFSNKQRLATLYQDLEEHKQQLTLLVEESTKARKEHDTVQEQYNHWETISKYTWEDIKVPELQEKHTYLQEELKQLEKGTDDLIVTKQQWDIAKQKLTSLNSDKYEQSIHRGKLEEKITDVKIKQQKAFTAASKGLEDCIRDILTKRIGVLTEENLEHFFEIESQYNKVIDDELEKERSDQNKASGRIIQIMSSFHTKWETDAIEWGKNINSLSYYLEHLQKIEKEGLPTLVERFKERLNKHATQSIARIYQQLDAESSNILDRIKLINDVLKRTDFRQGTHLQLGTKTELYTHVKEFKLHVHKVLSDLTSEDSEARYQQLKLVIDILEKASNSLSANTNRSLQLLDPRYQMSFHAEERDNHSNEIKDVLASTSGKSGGEKETFAGIIVAASLAYVLTPDGANKPIYSTVFLDEAFSNTSESFSRRVLQVFKELHIHVNLITPYKNLNIARESAHSLLLVERDITTHESHLAEVTWEIIDQQQAEYNKRILSEAEQFNIQLSN